MHNPLRWAAELISSFACHGVQHAIISPGSRSTLLTTAAALHPTINNSVVLDERSAAFTALGIGKATGKPALLICTSGTAAANYFPAMIEAGESGVPMIILSADRPPNLRGIGSSQTIDQLKLFGNHSVFFHESGEPSDNERDYKRLRYLAKQSVHQSIKKGGAAHINLPFRKPLESEAAQVAEVRKLYEAEASKTPVPFRSATSVVKLSSEICSLFNRSKKPLIIAGPANPHHQLTPLTRTLSEKIKAPVLAEPGSGFYAEEHSVMRFEQILRNKGIRNDLTPDLIIRFGDQPYTKSLLTALDGWDHIPLIHISARDAVQDHSLTITHSVAIQPADSLSLDFINGKESNHWTDRWHKQDQKAGKILAITLKNETELTDGHIFHQLNHKLGTNWNVMISNSFPVRDMALFGGTTERQFVNRGAAGIDGITSTAAGIQTAGNKPTCCFIGDLAFLHDSNALQTISRLNHPFLVVIINNKGGTIFRMLPVFGNSINSNLPANFYTTYFETPQNTNIELLARASGLDYLKIDSLQKLIKFEPGNIRAPLIVECVTKTDASMNMRLKLWNFQDEIL